MTVFIDRPRQWPQAPKPGAERHFGNGKWSAHMTCDGDIEELHQMAERIGLKRSWFQDHHYSALRHYDLVPSKFALAWKSGAVYVGSPLTAVEKRRFGVA